jgi:hypothetical protein
MDATNQAEFDRLALWLDGRAQAVQTVVFTGSRTWNKPLIRQVLVLLPTKAILRHGAAAGADTLADQIWNWLGGRTDVHPGRRGEYLARDRHMVDLGADCCIACIRGGSKGASYTAAYAIQSQIETFIFRD